MQRGGKREGAGRKKILEQKKYLTVSIRISKYELAKQKIKELAKEFNTN